MAALVFPTTKGACNPPLTPANDPVATGDTTTLDNGVLYVVAVSGGVNEWTAVGSAGPSLNTTYVNVSGDNMTGSLTLGGDPGDPNISLNATTGVVTTDGNVNITNEAGTPQITLASTGRVSELITAIPDDAAWDMADSNLWTTAASKIVNPSNTEPGQCGLIYTTAEVSEWGTYFKFPGGNVPTVPANSVIPYYVATQNVISMGNATEAIA